jgi:hypothetical protein
MKWVIVFLACGNGHIDERTMPQETRAANMPGFATREDCDAGLADLKAGFSAAYKHSVMPNLSEPSYVCRPNP